MSWDSYLDNLKAQSNNKQGIPAVKASAIISLDGGASWISPNHPNGINGVINEYGIIAKVMKSGDFSHFKENGIGLEKKHYFFISEIPNGHGVMGRLEGEGVVVISCSRSAVIMAVIDEEEVPRSKDGIKAVTIIKDYLLSVGL
jgi:profilin